MRKSTKKIQEIHELINTNLHSSTILSFALLLRQKVTKATNKMNLHILIYQTLCLSRVGKNPGSTKRSSLVFAGFIGFLGFYFSAVFF